MWSERVGRWSVGGLVVVGCLISLGCSGGGGGKEPIDASPKSDSGKGGNGPPVICKDGGSASTRTGDTCACDSDCASGHCVDGVCCESACTGKCMTCNALGSAGTCRPVAAGGKPTNASDCTLGGQCGQDGTCDGNGGCRDYVQGTLCNKDKATCSGDGMTGVYVCDGKGACSPGPDQSCYPYHCSGTTCATQCATNSDCSVGVNCQGGKCGTLPNGRPCSGNSDCTSGFCADGVCCSSACTAACLSCNQTGYAGKCLALAAGLADPQCTATPKSTCGKTGACDGFGNCALYPKETECIPATCSGSINLTAGTCDGLGYCQAGGQIDCAPFQCSGTACIPICKSDNDCLSPNSCMNGSCGKKPNGSSCKAGSECLSSYCVDGLCCDTDCTGACQSCALTSAPGKCSNAPAGQLDPHHQCKDMGRTFCGTDGYCDGKGTCEQYPPETVCADETCVGGAYTPQATCTASGQCIAPPSRTCFPFACAGNSCYSVCSQNNQCAANNSCLNGSCGLKPPGASCSAAAECQPAPDQKSYCSSGVCCNSSCTNACQACNLSGSVGTCTTIADGTADSRCATTAVGTCGTNGKCRSGACDVYHTTDQCKAATCSGTNQVLASFCDGRGDACPAQASQSCGNYACNSATATCKTTCTSDGDCVSPKTCNANSCGTKANGSACTGATQCTSGNCTEGVCCNTTCTDASNGTCQSCKVSGHVGTCTPVANGGSDPKSRCTATASTSCGLDGACDGTGKCRNWSTSTACRNQSCAGITQTNAATCNGTGACSAVTTKSCDPYGCNGTTACKTTCISSADCNNVTCNTQTNKCGDKLAAGQACGAGTDCSSGFCALTTAGNGVCCNTACNTPASCSSTQGIAASYCSTAGSCQTGAATTIDDANPCTTDTCNASTGQVTHTNNTNACGTASCASGIGTTAGTCTGGACKGSVTATIDDGNPCTADGCSSAGVVTHTNVADGTSCSDGNACNGAETCMAGVCKAGTPVVCTALDQCHTAGTCNSSSGACSNPTVANGTACNDGNACTQTDTCQSGTCTGGNPVTCTASDQCHTAGTCNSSTGACSNPTAANGTTCNDGNACTQTDTCQSGTCTGGNPVTCTASDQCHTAGTCNSSSGACSNPTVANGTACNDGNACTQADTCQSGTCTGGTPVTCIASDQCHTAGTCNSSTGLCSNPTVANGTACSDGNACTQADTCQSGTCTGTPVTCTASDQCHTAGTCSSSTGACSNPTVANGTACNDGNACTQTDTCQSGTCTGGTPVTCAASDQCHTAGTCNSSTGTCSYSTVANGTACSDGNACTQTDTCQNGTCTGADPVVCAASDDCHAAGTCDPGSGQCSNPEQPDNTPCNNGSSTCLAGLCI